MRLYNTLSRKIEEFQPLNPPAVNFYSCGPTVYDVTHIGHMRTYINNDVLKRTLNYLGVKVNHVMNITDVGHLTGDDDTGEDKLEKGAEATGKTVWEVAKFYTGFFLKTIKAVNILMPDKLVKATDHIQTMIDLIKKLEKKSLVYQTDEAVYFETSKFKNYGKLSGQKLEEKKKGAREDVYLDPQKKNSTDFALWFKRVGRFKDHTMHWDSPWGDGFPGWHIECSAMSMKYLGETLDIHSGGVDHIPVHHENEIAQSEGATGKPFSKYWVHHEFLLVDGKKMSKSLGNFYTIEDLKKNKIDPLAVRLLFLQTHYRQQTNFTWEAARAVQEAYEKLKSLVVDLKSSKRSSLSEEKLKNVDENRNKFNEAISNDIQMPQAVAVMWEMLKSNIPSPDKFDLLLEFDKVLGLKLGEVEEEQIPNDIKKLAEERLEARKSNDFKKSDELRKKINKMGFVIEDTTDGYRLKKST